MTDLQVMIASLTASVAQLTQAQAARTASEPTRTSPKDPKVADPEFFKGDRHKLPSFLAELQLVFTLHAARYPTDEIKVAYACSLLRDTPLDAVRPALANAEDPKMKSYSLFIKYLKENFGDPDEKGTARRELRQLRQTSSAADYFAKFNQYIAVLGWTDSEQLVDRAIVGLKPYLKDELARQSDKDFASLSSLVAHVIKLDNSMYERLCEREAERRVTSPASPAVPASYSGVARPSPVPARTSPTFAPDTPSQVPVAFSQPFSPPRGPVSDAEKAERRAKGLCHYCGSGDHLMANCPPLLRKGLQPAIKQEYGVTGTSSTSRPLPPIPAQPPVTSSSDSKKESGSSM